MLGDAPWDAFAVISFPGYFSPDPEWFEQCCQNMRESSNQQRGRRIAEGSRSKDDAHAFLRGFDMAMMKRSPRAAAMDSQGVRMDWTGFRDEQR